MAGKFGFGRERRVAFCIENRLGGVRPQGKHETIPRAKNPSIYNPLGKTNPPR